MKIYVDELPESPHLDCLFYNAKGPGGNCILWACDCSDGTCPLVLLDPPTEKTDAG